MAKLDNLDQTFNFVRLNDKNVIRVNNSNNYLMAEYDATTGVTRWVRVVNASQKESVQEWLKAHYPVGAPPAKARTRSSAA